MRIILAFAAASLLLLSCGESDSFSFTLVNHDDDLTLDGGDNLFFIEMESGSRSLDPTRLNVTLQEPGEDRFQMNHVLDTDTEDDGLFGPGDRLLVREPGVSFVGPEAEGTSFQVELSEEDEDNPTFVTRLWTGTWEP